MSLGPGTRARVGQLYPSGGICDYELQLMAPEGVQFLTTRVPFERTGVADDLRFARAVAEHSELLAHAQVDLIAVNCTAATMIAGSASVVTAVRERSGVPAVTTIDAVLAALDELGVRRVALVTPYVPEVVRAETGFLADHGVEVVHATGRPRRTPVEQGLISSDDWVRTIAELPTDGLDGILVSCAGVQIAPVIEQVEEQLRLPVVTSNQALLWWVLRTLRIDIGVEGYGELLRRTRA